MKITAMKIKILTCEVTKMNRILVCDIDEAVSVLSDIIEDFDGSDRLMITDENMDEAVQMLNENGIDYDII